MVAVVILELPEGTYISCRLFCVVFLLAPILDERPSQAVPVDPGKVFCSLAFSKIRMNSSVLLSSTIVLANWFYMLTVQTYSCSIRVQVGNSPTLSGLLARKAPSPFQ